VAPTPIGTEVRDPAYFEFSSGCPLGYPCRYSNASRAAYASGVSFSLGRIARTSGPNISSDPTNNPKTITGSFSITGEGNASVGVTVNKVGYRTGWTRGRVTNSCVNILATNGAVFLCQNIVAAGVGAGDGGSPVFKGTTGVTLAGILWGRNDTGTLYAYSPLRNIERELGLLTTF
jgi:hypothetical protein